VPSIARTHPPTAERMRRLLALGRPALIDRYGL
jgi:Zn-dependent protease with chaperone function